MCEAERVIYSDHLEWLRLMKECEMVWLMDFLGFKYSGFEGAGTVDGMPVAARLGLRLEADGIGMRAGSL